MPRRKYKSLMILATEAVAIVLGLTIWHGGVDSAWAQPIPFVSNSNYFRVATGFDNTVRIINPTSQTLTLGGFLCANTYVFDGKQELQECCGCHVTNNGLRVISVQKDLLSNPLSSPAPVVGAIEIVSSLPNTTSPTGLPDCNPALSSSLTPELRSYITHTLLPSPGTGIGEVRFKDGHFDSDEAANLQSLCAFIHTNGTGRGICTCGTGDDFAPTPSAGKR